MCTVIQIVLVVFLLDLILRFRSSVRGGRSIGCIVSKVPFLSRMIRVLTCLKSWVIFFVFFRSFTVIIVFVFVIVIVAVIDSRDRVLGVTVSDSGIKLNGFSSLFLSSEVATLISVMSRVFSVVARRFLSVSIRVSNMLADNVHP